MLRVTRRGRIEQVRDLMLDEDRALRRAFGCGAEEEARPAGAAVVRAHQHQKGGQWFLCDCLGEVAYPPALVPVAELHVRRHVEPPWPEHAAWCDFFRDPLEQRLVTTSYSRPPPGVKLRLVDAYREDQRTEARVTGHSVHRRRSRLATLLMTLIEAAKLNRIEAAAPNVRLSEQYRALREAAREVELDEGIPLSSYLCTYPPALPELVAKIARTEPARFGRTRRPHGILIGMANAVRAGHVEPFQGDAIPVSGEIAIFGEVDGHSEHRPASVDTRPPYLMICLVGRFGVNQPVGVLKAYLHPCAGPGNLMPVDSNLERQTLAVLRRFQTWIGEREATRITIEKPVFNLALPTAVLETEGEPCLPDFIVRTAEGAPDEPLGMIVETMGYSVPAYRERKQRTHELMSQALHGAPVIAHDFHLPIDQVQRERDRWFWRACRRTLDVI